MTVFNTKATNHLNAKIFFDEGGSLGVARYDQVKYPELEHLTKKQIGFFWTPEEVDVSKDRSDFRSLEAGEQHIFTSNLQRQIVLDSVQGRSPTLVFTPICGLPEMEVFTQAWAFMETIHSRSYTHIIQNIYSHPGEVFDNMMDIPEIVACAADISRYYDDFAEYSLVYQLLGYGEHSLITKTDGVSKVKNYNINEYDLKKKLFLTLASVNILEGIRFYVSFACSWAFAENRLMEGNAKIIKLICRDENLHLSATQKLMRTILIEDDPIYARIKEDTREEVEKMFLDAAEQEKDWAKYLFKDASIIGLNEDLLCRYVDYITSHRMRSAGYTPNFMAPKSNPLPWTADWISSKGSQPAPQETEITSYVSGALDTNIEKNAFAGIEL